ncbi:Magnesium transporter mrs2-like protein [Populus alba x Populus x berolinensis]|nr:Magnesium transporter mrs2-like protein [Populus alba x Populus x berolinensis]
MLLEAYFMQIDSTLNKLTTLREYIDDTEDYINIQVGHVESNAEVCFLVYAFFLTLNLCILFLQLDNHRNQLIQLELFLSFGTACLSIYSLVAGICGVNIPYTWNDNHGYLFKWVVIVTGAFCASMFLVLMAYARYKGLVGS